LKVEKMIVGILATNCYFAICRETKEAVVIDPGAEGKKIFARINNLSLNIKAIINTHGHIDHVCANGYLKGKTKAPLMISEKDLGIYKNPGFGLKLLTLRQPAPDHLLSGGDRIDFGNYTLTVLETPGHTPGGISLSGEEVLFCGDSLFAGSIGRTDLPGGSYDELIKSINERLLTLTPDTVLYPGHGPASTVRTEIKSNPFVL